MTLVIHTQSSEATRTFGAKLADAILQSSSEQALVIALNGELGAGKTTLVSGLLKAFGATGPIRSPTYTLIEPYELSSRKFYHLDLYRLANTDELEMIAPRDLLEPYAVLLVEWAERAGKALPIADLSITLRYLETESSNSLSESNRILEIQSATSMGRALITQLEVFSDISSVSS